MDEEYRNHDELFYSSLCVRITSPEQPGPASAFACRRKENIALAMCIYKVKYIFRYRVFLSWSLIFFSISASVST